MAGHNARPLGLWLGGVCVLVYILCATQLAGATPSNGPPNGIAATPIDAPPNGIAATPSDGPPKEGAPVDDWPPKTPRFRIIASNILGGSYNPEGIENNLRLGLQTLLYRSKNPIFRENFVFLGVNPRINPVGLRAGPSIEIQPLTAFNLRLNAEFVNYFGSLGAIQSFRSPLADSSGHGREPAEKRGENYGTTGARFSITPFLQGKVGPIVLRDQFTFEYFSMNLTPGHSVFYEPAYDMLVPKNGKLITNDLDLFFVRDLPAGGFFDRGRIVLGARYTLIKPFFNETDFSPGENAQVEKNETHRVGPLVAMTLWDDGFTRFQKPTVVAFAQWYLAHRNRLGVDMDQAVPYLVLAFIFQSDVWISSD